MSHYTQDPSRHDLFVSLAIRKLRTDIPGIRVLASHGGLPLVDTLAPNPLNILGYIPDGLLISDESHWVLEVKSFSDLYSAHTRNQMETMLNLVNSTNDVAAFLVVFDVPIDAIAETVVPPNFVHNKITVQLIREDSTVEL